MALPPPSNDVFLREVDDELRRDEIVAFWRRWGKWVVVGIIVALAAFAAFLGWQHYRETRAGREGEQLSQAYEALGAQAFAKADPMLAALAGSNREGYRAMALFTQGDVLVQQQKAPAAAAKFASIAGDAAFAKPFRDLALIRQTAAEFDRLKPAVVVERLRPLAVPGGPWLGSAGELLAAAYIAEGRRDLAATLFGQIGRGDDVPPSLRQRAVQMASVLTAEASAAGGEAKAR